MNYLFTWIREASKTCFSFAIYDKIVHQSTKRSLMYFLILMFVSIVMIYPFYISRQMKLIYPLFEFLEQSFPPLEFKDYILTSQFDPPLSLETPLFHIWIDPDNTTSEPLFDEILVSVKKDGLEFKTKRSSTTMASNTMAYHGYYLKHFFHAFGNIENGTGTLDHTFFKNLKQELSSNKLSNFLLFGALFVLISFLVQLCLTFFGKYYAKWVHAPLTWKNLLNLGFYSCTPVFLLLIGAFYFGFTLGRLFPIALGAYLLFFSNSIRRFATKPPISEESFNFL